MENITQGFMIFSMMRVHQKKIVSDGRIIPKGYLFCNCIRYPYDGIVDYRLNVRILDFFKLPTKIYGVHNKIKSKNMSKDRISQITEGITIR